MPVVQSGINAVSSHLPKVLTSKTHAIADYVSVAGFAIVGALLWKKNRRAAVASLVCAGAGATVALLTDYPGGVADSVNFPLHGRIEMGLAATASALPGFLGFEDEPEAKIFKAMGIASTVAMALTDFGRARGAGRGRLKRAS